MKTDNNPELYPALTQFDEETQEGLREIAADIKKFLHRAFAAEKDAKEYLAAAKLNNDELLGLWCLLESHEKAALKRHNH